MNPKYELIETEAALLAACDQLRGAPLLCVDTEFHREKTYYPEFALLQVASREHCFLIDPLEVKDLAPIWAILLDPASVKVFHAARQDLEIVLKATGQLPLPLFDTQVAAALLGYGQQVGFGSLVQTVLKKQLAKQESFSDWLSRPLNRKQLDYAAEDVIYLVPLYQFLRERLQARGRESWLDEEQSELCNPATYMPDPNDLFWRVKGVNKLKPKQLAVLQAMTAWREEEAQKRDLPRRRIIPDEVLADLAKRSELELDDLNRMRGLAPGLVRKFGDGLLAAWTRGLDCPQEQWPRYHERQHYTSGTDLRMELLDALVQLRAEQEKIAGNILCNRSEMTELASWAHRKGELPELACLTGWRRELVGEDMLRLLRGELALRLDPKTALPLIADHFE